MELRNLIAGFAFLVSGAADAGTIFLPGDGDVNYLFSSLTPGTDLVMFDDADFGGTALAIPVPEVIDFTAGGIAAGDWTATNESGSSINLTNGPLFQLGITTDGGLTYEMNTSATKIGASSYRVAFSEGTVLQVDLTRIPVPAAVWLFGSAMAGLVYIQRRKSKIVTTAMS